MRVVDVVLAERHDVGGRANIKDARAARGPVVDRRVLLGDLREEPEAFGLAEGPLNTPRSVVATVGRPPLTYSTLSSLSNFRPLNFSGMSLSDRSTLHPHSARIAA